MLVGSALEPWELPSCSSSYDSLRFLSPRETSAPAAQRIHTHACIHIQRLHMSTYCTHSQTHTSHKHNNIAAQTQMCHTDGNWRCFPGLLLSIWVPFVWCKETVNSKTGGIHVAHMNMCWWINSCGVVWYLSCRSQIHSTCLNCSKALFVVATWCGCDR